MRRFTTHFTKSVSALVLAISFFFVSSIPVFADYVVNTYRVESWQVIAYEYWNGTGFNLVDQKSNDTTITIPQYAINSGNTRYDLICNTPNYTGDDGDYACYYRDRTSGQVYGTWYTNTSVAHQEVVHNVVVNGIEVPWLSTNNYIHENAYNDNHAIWLPGKGSEGDSNNLYVAFISNINPQNTSNYTGTNAVDNLYLKLWSLNGDNGFTVERTSLSATDVGPAYYFNSIKITNNNTRGTWVTIDFPKFSNSTKIIPVYTGTGNDLPDYARNTVGIPTRTETFLQSLVSSQGQLLQQEQQTTLAAQKQNSLSEFGNSFSQNRQQALSEQNTELTNKVNQMNSIESDYSTSLNTALDDINLDTDLVQHSGFTNAALWVGTQFNRLVIGTPFELVMMFSLVTGLALVLIGKLRS